METGRGAALPMGDLEETLPPELGLISRELGPTTLLGILDQARDAVRSGHFADLAAGDAPRRT